MRGRRILKGIGLSALLFLWSSGSRATTHSAPPPSPSVQSAAPSQKSKVSSKNRTNRSRGSQDFWTKCQNLKKSLSKGDLDDSYPKDPVIQDIPSVKPASIPCKFQPDTKSTAGARAKCNF